ncbi:MAG: TDP-N-acetylfucosamine:lipid II N-acetylfucosaminyltransferase [Sodalis sp.]|uniref:TDP-N-acetylfucosamine:lipid II N-acetylfucosaminyltransferase n=1 Tax=Sodalis sp. (in: enterobacteria) TaxID=1898979 RepID=UPI0038731010|nr:MAG: TDP-N-acetylfucosamine:lipid II N-acetylfucosaminyltransferase [Sodalis sp.]
MSNLIHVLGSDIPRHNLTVLRFFNDTLAAICPPAQIRRFMVVAPNGAPLSGYSQVDIECFDSKRALTKALVRRGNAAPDERYFLHGQFNPLLWLAMLTGKIHPVRISWHVWGADLYEESRRLHHRLFYLLRRRAQGQVGHVFATRGDLACYRQRYPSVPASLLYFPTRLAADIVRVAPAEAGNRPLTLLVGNSGDPSNRHCQALRAIHHQFGIAVKIIMPMGYPAGNDTYIAMVRAESERCFHEEQVRILTEPLAFNDYLALLQECDAGYFLFRRQQGIGTLSLLIQLGLPFVLSRHNPFCQDLIAQQVPVLYEDDALDLAIIRETQRRMLTQDPARIAFFYPNILHGWCQALSIAAGVPL